MKKSQDLCLSEERGLKVRSGTGFVSVWAAEIIIKQTASFIEKFKQTHVGLQPLIKSPCLTDPLQPDPIINLCNRTNSCVFTISRHSNIDNVISLLDLLTATLLLGATVIRDIPVKRDITASKG